MARKNTVKIPDEEEWLGFLPKRRAIAASISLGITIMSAVMDSMLKNVLIAFTGIFAILTVILVVLGLVAFMSALEHREGRHSIREKLLRDEIATQISSFEVQCERCNFNYQSLLVGLSEKHVNELQDQRVFYEDYTAAVLYTFNAVLARMLKSESSVIPIIDAIKEDPLRKKVLIEEPQELLKWKIFLKEIQEKINGNNTTTHK